MNIVEFKKEIETLGLILNDHQYSQLEKYYELLKEWNKKINLTSIIEKDQVYLKHFYDSVTLTQIVNFEEIKTICDIGTGAGFPGIVLKIVFPELEVTLVDALNKRIKFLDLVIDKLCLKKIKTVHIRAEEYGTEKREYYDMVTARAVAHLSNLLEYTIPLLKENGIFVAMKGSCEEELEESRNAMKVLNCKVQQIKEFDLPFQAGYRTLIRIHKKKKTDKRYPRRYSEIKKNRL